MYRAFTIDLYYLRASSKSHRSYNFLQYSHFLLMLLNLTSMLAGVCLSGCQYAKAFYHYYLLPQGTEADLIRWNLKDIARYREFDSKIIQTV